MIKKFDSIVEMDAYINPRIPGDFSGDDMLILADYVKRLKSGDFYLEIGVQYGKSAAVAIFTAVKGVQIYLCDIEDIPAMPEIHNRMSRQYYFESEGLDKKSTFILKNSIELAAKWNNNTKLNLIFIDGNHNYEGVKGDIEGWVPHLKSGGTILFHDYGGGVQEAVDELVKDSSNFKDFFIGMEKYSIHSSSIVGATKV